MSCSVFVLMAHEWFTSSSECLLEGLRLPPAEGDRALKVIGSNWKSGG